MRSFDLLVRYRGVDVGYSSVLVMSNWLEVVFNDMFIYTVSPYRPRISNRLIVLFTSASSQLEPDSTSHALPIIKRQRDY